MSAVSITFEIDGQPVPAHDAVWFEVAPCGCISGATVIDHQDHQVLTEADAWRSFYEGESENRRRDEASGFTMRLGRRDNPAFLLRCPHIPLWGVEPLPEMDGYGWATEDRFPSGKDRRHLVPVDAIVPEGERNPHFPASTTPPLCGKRPHYWWHAGPWSTSAPTCRLCERAARKAGHVVVEAQR